MSINSFLLCQTLSLRTTQNKPPLDIVLGWWEASGEGLRISPFRHRLICSLKISAFPDSVQVPYTRLKVFLVTNHIYIRVLLAHKCHWSCNCARHKTVESRSAWNSKKLLKHLQLPQKLCFFFFSMSWEWVTQFVSFFSFFPFCQPVFSGSPVHSEASLLLVFGSQWAPESSSFQPN